MDIYLHKNPLKQAPALTVNMLCVLELASFCEKDKFLRAFAGFILFCVYGRLRVSDLNRLVRCSLLGNYVEGSLMKVKTARSKEKQCTFLPVVAPAMGVLGTRWFQAFVLNRATLELDNIPSLESRASNESFGVLPSDSLKSTLLTYLGKHGCDYTYSELLGYHLTQHKSALNYQRDALADPIRFLTLLLDKIKVGSFCPDAVRGEELPADWKSSLGHLESSAGCNLSSICELFLEESVDEMLGPAGNSDLQVLWDLLCQEDTSMSEGKGPKVAGRCDEETVLTEIENDQSCESDSGSSSVESVVAKVAADNMGQRRPRGVSSHAIMEMIYRHTFTLSIKTTVAGLRAVVY